MSAFGGLPFTVPVKYQGFILMASQRWGIPPNVLASQIKQESDFQENVTSSTGAEGIAQFEPGTAASEGVNPWDPASAIDGMAKLDASYVKEFGSIDLALAAYNAGPDAVRRAGNQIPSIAQTENYVRAILSAASQAGPTGATDATGTPPPDTSGAFSGVETLLGNVVNPDFWKRVGKGAAAGGIVIVGVYFLMEKKPGSLKPVKELVNVK
jgi:Transglycosylase SLT domain